MIQTEEYTGASCTGSNGASNRVLTLANTKRTIQPGFLVTASGLYLSLTSEYTVSHAISGTTITFLNPLFNDMNIIVRYYESGTSVGSDFEEGPLADFGRTVTRTPVTITTDFHGQKTYTDGSNEDILVVFENIRRAYPLDRSGVTQAFDARMFTLPDQEINKGDKITNDSKVYRVDTVNVRHFDGTTMYKMVTLFFIDD